MYRVHVTLPNGNESQTTAFSNFGDANRWAMSYTRGGRVGSEAWVVHSSGQTVASYMTDSMGRTTVSARAERDQMLVEMVNGENKPHVT